MTKPASHRSQIDYGTMRVIPLQSRRFRRIEAPINSIVRYSANSVASVNGLSQAEESSMGSRRMVDIIIGLNEFFYGHDLKLGHVSQAIQSGQTFKNSLDKNQSGIEMRLGGFLIIVGS